jgi:hypothetical protein
MPNLMCGSGRIRVWYRKNVRTFAVATFARYQMVRIRTRMQQHRAALMARKRSTIPTTHKQPSQNWITIFNDWHAPCNGNRHFCGCRIRAHRQVEIVRVSFQRRWFQLQKHVGYLDENLRTPQSIHPILIKWQYHARASATVGTMVTTTLRFLRSLNALHAPSGSLQANVWGTFHSCNQNSTLEYTKYVGPA